MPKSDEKLISEIQTNFDRAYDAEAATRMTTFNTFRVLTRDLLTGMHTFTVRATDTSGNVTTSAPITIQK